MIGVAKMTFVFLSYLNEALSAIPIMWVMVAFFLIGLTMFLLPPVPGVPVYITSGIILAARGDSNPNIGYTGGVLLAVALSFVLKLIACCLQYLIGYFLGKSVKIQQLVGVDKVVMKAVEKILVRKGINLPKVAVLIGGPDWPTSVIY